MDERILHDIEMLGYDAAVNGADLHNTHFSIFNTKKSKEAWERGYKRGKGEEVDE